MMQRGLFSGLRHAARNSQQIRTFTSESLPFLSVCCGQPPPSSPGKLRKNAYTASPWAGRPSLSLGNTTTGRRWVSMETTPCPLVGSDGVVRSPLGDVDVPMQTVAQYVMSDFEKFGNNIALVDAITNRKLSYAELHDSIVRVASALSRLGLGKDDVITIMAPNSIEWAIMYLAASLTGAVVSAVNPLYTAGELTHAVGHSESKFIITISELAHIAKETSAKCPSVKEIIVFNECDGCRPFSQLLADDGLRFPEDTPVSPSEDIMALPYSSGTTGLPKGVMLTHTNIIANIEQMRHDSVMRHQPGKTLVGFLPFFHIYGQVIVMLAGFKAGVTIAVMPKFDPEVYLSAVSKHRAEFLHVVPPIVLFLAKHPLVAKYDLSSVDSLFVGAAPCGPEMIAEALEKVNKNAYFRQGYGLTEASPLTHCILRDSISHGRTGNIKYRLQGNRRGER